MQNFMQHDFNVGKIIIACFVPAGTGLAVHVNRPGHGIAMHLGGEKMYTFSDGKILTVKENDIIYLPKHSTYEVLSKVHGDCYAINFDTAEDVGFSPFVAHVKNHKEVQEHFCTANSAWEAKKQSYIMQCKAELYQIISTLQQEYISEYFPQNKLEIIQSAIDYIHETYTEKPIRIDWLSAMCGITPEYFRRIFKSFYGVSPLHYINNLKITRAKELLKSHMYSVSDAAFLSGYTEMSHFSREFKKATGYSPSDYIKRSVQ